MMNRRVVVGPYDVTSLPIQLVFTDPTANQHTAGDSVHVSGIRPEEVTRADAQAARSWRYARWIDGGQLSWIGRRVRPGRGSGSSGLRFDLALRVEGPATPSVAHQPTRAASTRVLPSTSGGTTADTSAGDGIAGISTLRGVLVYAAVLTSAAL